VTSAFERFIGIDWSGAEGERQSGIQVFEVSDKTKSPERRPTLNGGKCWSRWDVLKFIDSLSGCRILVGLDFAFSVPWDSSLGCLPPCLSQLQGAHGLWKLIDHFCKDIPHLYGGPIWRAEASPFRPFIKFWSKEKEYEREIREASLLRRTERFAGNYDLMKKSRVRPISVYRMAGPQVGAGSFAGMRMLHALASTRSDIAIWPFDSIDKATVVVLEIYPALFYALARQKRPTKDKIKSGDHRQVVRQVLEFCGVNYNVDIPSVVDAIDAMVAAAGIYFLSRRSENFRIAHDEISAKEGWIFGVPFGESQ
jgi:hypothetical protein